MIFTERHYYGNGALSFCNFQNRLIKCWAKTFQIYYHEALPGARHHALVERAFHDGYSTESNGDLNPNQMMNFKQVAYVNFSRRPMH